MSHRAVRMVLHCNVLDGVGLCFMGGKEDELHNIMLSGPSVVSGSCDFCLSEGDMTDRVTAAVAIFAGSVLLLSL